MASPDSLSRIVGLYGTKANIENFEQTLSEFLVAVSSDTGEIGFYMAGVWVWIAGATITASAPILSSGGAAPNLSHALSGVSAGTYSSVTVDTYGHVTAGGTHEVLMVDGTTPPEPMTTEDETDWLYSG